MTEKYLIELINKDIDGELTSKEKELLQAEISGNPEAAKLDKELRQAVGMLKDDKDASAEIDVREDVMRIISRRKQPEYSSPALRKSFFLNARSPWVVAFSMGMLAGIIILYAFYAAGVINTQEPGLTGTMSSIETYADFVKADDISIALNNSRGTISSQFSRDMVIASIDLSSDERISVDLKFNENNLQVYSIKPVSINNQSNVASGRNSILINNVGENKYMVFFRHDSRMTKTEPISVRLMSESGHSAEYSLLTSN